MHHAARTEASCRTAPTASRASRWFTAEMASRSAIAWRNRLSLHAAAIVASSVSRALWADRMILLRQFALGRLAPRLALRTIRRLNYLSRALTLLANGAGPHGSQRITDSSNVHSYRSNRPKKPSGATTGQRTSPSVLRASPNLILQPLPSARNLRYHALQPTRDGAQPGINELVDCTHEDLNCVFHPNVRFMCEPHAATDVLHEPNMVTSTGVVLQQRSPPAARVGPRARG